MKCPDCGGEMWDNRTKKKSGEYSSKNPDFKCKDKAGCGKAVWLPTKPVDDAEPPDNEWDDGIEYDDSVMPSDRETDLMLDVFDRCWTHLSKIYYVSMDAKLDAARNMAVSVFITKTQNGR